MFSLITRAKGPIHIFIFPPSLLPCCYCFCWSHLLLLLGGQLSGLMLLRLLNLSRIGLHVRFGEELVLCPPDTPLREPYSSSRSVHDDHQHHRHSDDVRSTSSTYSSGSYGSKRRSWWSFLTTCICCCHPASCHSRTT